MTFWPRLSASLALLALLGCQQAGAHGAAAPERAAAGPPPERPHLVAALPGVRFVRPVDLVTAPAGERRMFVAETDGRVWSIEGDASAARARLVIDLSQSVAYDAPGEGLLAIALDARFAETGDLFVHYVRKGPIKYTVLSRFRLGGGDTSPAEEILLEIEQFADGEKGGDLLFGPDGMLYVAVGSGGLGDPLGFRHARTSLLGKVLRLDVGVLSMSLNYSLPPGNPYQGNREGAREEIFAGGYRNVRTLVFDRSGGLWGLDHAPGTRQASFRSGLGRMAVRGRERPWADRRRLARSWTTKARFSSPRPPPEICGGSSSARHLPLRPGGGRRRRSRRSLLAPMALRSC